MFEWVRDAFEYFVPPTFDELEFGNVYIFNKIKNNSKDVELLRQTFEALNCTVVEVQNRSYKHLKANIKTITAADFSHLKYIVIIILDNTNKEEGIWITTDKKKFHTNGHLLTKLHKNITLQGKLRLAILQTNRDSPDKPTSRLRNVKKVQNKIPSKRYPGKDVKFYATSSECCLNHEWDAEVPSPFIRILCEEIMNNRTSLQPITNMLDRVADRVANETDDLPSTEINVSEEVYLSMATV